ncbi:MAG TPA: aminotransferase class V-fold PLP-dependent enzyme [Polyangiaceae bacterium]|nr:aminotransferase class V-fold PLP-dependent enzyme [Polyangiaceae bacterium]
MDSPTPERPWAPLWRLRPDVFYLNHGSYGACPAAILEHQARLRAELEAEPTDFLSRELDGRLAEARAALGAFVGADPDDLGFVTNATSGVNAVLRSLEFGPGDELLTTDHAYAACRKTMDYVASRTGARVVVAEVPFPIAGDDAIVDALVGAVTPRTRLALIDHVTSPTALVFPVARIVRELEARGVDTLVDAAHAPGNVPMNLREAGAAYTSANAHKWLCAPKGAAFLHVRRDRQRAIHPLTISHGYDPSSGEANFVAEWGWAGTSDPTAWLSIPECIRYLGSLLPGGWPELMARNRALALRARDLFVASLGVAPPCPDSMVGAMASVPLPAAEPGSPLARLDHKGLSQWTRERGVESWFCLWPCAGGKLVRASAQLYNDESHYRRLVELLGEARRAA